MVTKSVPGSHALYSEFNILTVAKAGIAMMTKHIEH